MIEIPVLIAVVLALVIPLLSVGFSLLSEKMPFRIQVLIRCPPRLQPLNQRINREFSHMTFGSYLKREIGKRLGMVYFFIGLFFVSNFVGTFYQIVADQAMWLIDPNFTPRVLAGIGFDSPFSGGWFGSFEWYGQMFLPAEGSRVYHETWNWIFFSAGMTDDPTFFFGATRSILIFTIIFGLVFLFPLVKRSIRTSFFQSIFLLSSGMSILTRGIFGLFGQAWRMEYEAEFLRYGAIVVQGGQLQVTTELTLLLTLVPVILGFFAIFLLGAKWLWSMHYPEEQKPFNWLGLFIALQYWMSLALIMI